MCGGDPGSGLRGLMPPQYINDEIGVSMYMRVATLCLVPWCHGKFDMPALRHNDIAIVCTALVALVSPFNGAGVSRCVAVNPRFIALKL